jgi:NitT/TauT family transport system ATP-binding protein
MKQKTLEVSQVSHAFGITDVLDDINLKIEAGQVIALVGPSCCGKTTLLHLCAGLTKLLQGSITNSFSATAFMFQQPRLLPWKTTLDNIAIGLKAKRIAREQREMTSRQLGLRMGLVEEDFTKFPHELSGGMQQRAALARALVMKPDLLLLDEPFSALDIGLKSELYGLLVEQLIQQEAAVLMITHDLMEAVRLSDTILLMEADPGRIVKRFPIDKSLGERDDAWVYKMTAELMQAEEVRESFGLV